MIDVIADRIVRKNPFLCDWSNYGIVDIFNPVATAQYQHSVTIPTKPGMMHDFRDLRFFQPDGTEIPFWNESKTDGSTSFNWIKPYSASQRKVYVFYGNREAVSQSNGDKVFEFFDDFLGSSLDTSKWTIEGGGPTVSGSNANISASSDAVVSAYSITVFGANYVSRARIYLSHFNNTTYNEGFGFEPQGSNRAGAWFTQTYSPFAGKYVTGNGSDNIQSITGVSVNSFFIMDIIRNGTTSVIYKVNGTNTVTSSSCVSASSLPVKMISSKSGAIFYCDWVLVRKYAATEPTCQLNQSGLRNPAYR